MTTAGIYTRLSLDRDGESTATERQEQDCRAVAERLGFTVARVYEDNDVSAYQRKKRRPAFEDMVADVAAGKLDAVIVWRSDRLARQPRDLERFIDASEANKVQLLSVSEPEFGGPMGLMILRIFVNFANYESGVKSERVARKNQELAEKGRHRNGGVRPFGYARVPWVDGQPKGLLVPHPVEAPLYREAVDRILAGESRNVVARDWRERGVPTVKGGLWTSGNFDRMLRSPAQAGIREYQGRRFDGAWEPLVPRERWNRLQVVLDGTAYQRSKVVTRHLLSGIARCGLCDGRMQGVWTKQPKTGNRVAVYRCDRSRGGCGRVSIDGARLEDMVSRRLIHVASTDHFATLVAGKAADAEDSLVRLMGQLREDETALAQLTKDHYVDRAIPRAAFLAAKDALDARIAVTREEVAKQATPALSAPQGDADALRREWQERGGAWRRSVLEALVRRVVCLPAPPGKRGPTWWTDRVNVEWLV